MFHRYDYDGNFEATPGQKRAVQEAVNALTARGHYVSYFSPRGLQEANVLYGLFTFADGGKSTMKKLANGPVDLQESCFCTSHGDSLLLQLVQ